VTDASNSSKQALKSHQAAADAWRAEEARKAAELKAQQVTDSAAETPETVESAHTNASTGPSGPPPTSLSRSSSQVVRSRNTSPGTTQSVSSDDEPEECVRPPKGKRKAIGTLTQIHNIRLLISVLLLVNADTLSEPSVDSSSIIRQKKKGTYHIALFSPTCNNNILSLDSETPEEQT
jgi:hypothetical protein